MHSLSLGVSAASDLVLPMAVLEAWTQESCRSRALNPSSHLRFEILSAFEPFSRVG
jgi:hypothetical protein